MQVKMPTAEMIDIALLKPYKKNTKRHDQTQIDNVAESIRKFGFVQPFVIDKNNEVVIGHCRLLAAQKLGIKELPCVRVDYLTAAQVKALRILDNKLNESEWDLDFLNEELPEIDLTGFDVDFGLDIEEAKYQDYTAGSLADKFGVPPFSVIDRRQGNWRERKREWLAKGIKSELGRAKSLLGSGLSKLCDNAKMNLVGGGGISVFDPVMCETAYKWFCPERGKILDCFAGGSVRGIVASELGYDYYGIDLREEQIAANIDNAKEIGCVMPHWFCGDSRNIAKIVPSQNYDLLFSCPPYGDTEVYSDDADDISNKDYDGFLTAYNEIIKNSVGLLAEDRFAVFVVGNFRDKKGNLRNFVADTVTAFENSGMRFYNEIIFVDPIGTAALRAGKTFSATRKVCRVHQVALVFYKGNISNIKDNYGKVEIPEVEVDE